MRKIAEFDQEDYNLDDTRFSAVSLKGIIIKDNKIMLLQNPQNNFLLIPGGSKSLYENNFDGLERIFKTKFNAEINIKSIKEYGYTREIRKDVKREKTIFELYTYFYEVKIDILEEDMEKNNLKYVSLLEAFEQNDNILSTGIQNKEIVNRIIRDNRVIKDLYERM